MRKKRRKNPPSRRMVARALLRARQFSQGRRKWPDRGTWPSDGVSELERINRVLGKLARKRIARKAWHATGSKMRTPERTMLEAMRYEDRLRGFPPRSNPSPVRGLAKARPTKRHPRRVRPTPYPYLNRTTGGLLYVRRGLKHLRPYRTGRKRKAARASNPLLQVVMPNRRRRRKNPPIHGYAGRGGSKVRGGQRISGVRFATPAEARTYPGFAKALETYKKFHGRAPTHFTKVRLEDGDAHVSRRAVVMIGEAPAIEYRTWRYANSTKSHTKDGRRITWRHKMGELGGKPAYYVHDPVSGVTSLLGGTYKVAGRPAFYHH